jgi:hypothetical protein
MLLDVSDFSEPGWILMKTLSWRPDKIGMATAGNRRAGKARLYSGMADFYHGADPRRRLQSHVSPYSSDMDAHEAVVDAPARLIVRSDVTLGATRIIANEDVPSSEGLLLYEIETEQVHATTRCAIGRVRNIRFLISAGGFEPWDWSEVIVLARRQELRIDSFCASED